MDSNTNIYTLRNYGQRVNCSLLAMHPAKIQILSLTVGINSYEKTRYIETGTFHNVSTPSPLLPMISSLKGTSILDSKIQKMKNVETF